MKKKTMIILMTVLTLVFTVSIGVAEEPVMLKGQVTEDNQLMTEDGELYDIAESENGEQVMDMVGETVEVRGTLIDSEDTKVIQVESFTVVE
jgi:hypothetical protein